MIAEMKNNRPHPLSWRLWGLLLLVAMVWLIEAYDIGLTGTVLPSLKAQWHLSAWQSSAVVSAPTLGVALGVFPAGVLADKLGRKTILQVALLYYTTLTVLTGLSDNWTMFVILRFLAGLGLGATFPIPYTLFAELAPSHARGRSAGILDAFLSIGYFTSPFLASWIFPYGGPGGWRQMFYLGAFGYLVLIAIMRFVPESPIWLSQARSTVIPSSKKLWSPSFRRQTAMLWIAFPAVLLLFYVIMNFMPSLLLKEGFSAHQALLFASLIMAASIPGKLIESWLVERIGRKPLLISFTLFAGLFALLFSHLHQFSEIIMAGMALSFFGIAVDPAMKIFTAEQYPTAIRAKGVGAAEAVARLLGGALAPFILEQALSSSGIQGTLIFTAVVTWLGTLALSLWAKETRFVALG